jgi:excisionase family DNA binding protein
MPSDQSQYAEREWSHEETSQPGYLSLRQAARWAGVSSKTIQRWIGKGLPRYQAGPREKVLIKRADIESFLTRKQKPVLDLNAMIDEVLQCVQLPHKHGD